MQTVSSCNFGYVLSHTNWFHAVIALGYQVNCHIEWYAHELAWLDIVVSWSVPADINHHYVQGLQNRVQRVAIISVLKIHSEPHVEHPEQLRCEQSALLPNS